MDKALWAIWTLVVGLGLAALLGAGMASEAGSVTSLVEQLPGAQLGAGNGAWHVVRPGETLRSIARDYYGTTTAWRSLQLSNDCELVPAPGTKLWLPAFIERPVAQP